MSRFIYDLVNSMTIGEKAYFKRFVNTHSEGKNTNYLQLYDSLDQMKTYDKKLLSSFFDGTTIGKYLSSEVNYLKEKILTSLINFNLKNSVTNKIGKEILFIEMLISKGFRKEAMKKLKFTKKVAYVHEEFTRILRVIELEEIVLFEEGIIGFKDTLKQLREERRNVTATIQNLNDLHILREEQRNLQFTDRVITDNFEKHKELYQNPLIENIENCLSKKAKEHWHYIQMIRKFLERDFQKGMLASIKHVYFLEENKTLFPPSKSLPILSNYIYHAALIGDRKLFFKGKEKLLHLSKVKDIDLDYLNYIICSRHLDFSYYNEDKEMMKEYLNLSISFVEKQIPNLGSSQIQYLFALIVRATITLREFELGALQVNLWSQTTMLPYKVVIFKLFSVIIHYELKWKQLLQSELLSLKKLAKKSPKEKALINAFYKFIEAYLKTFKETKKEILLFQKKLKAISENPEINFDYLVFDFYRWSLSLRLD